MTQLSAIGSNMELYLLRCSNVDFENQVAEKYKVEQAISKWRKVE